MSSEHLTRNEWSRTPLPAELIDLLKLIAEKHGYKDNIHFLIYALLDEVYPNDVATLAPYFDADWMDTSD